MDKRVALSKWMGERRDAMEKEEGWVYPESLTLTELARRMDRKLTTVSRWFNGLNLPANFDDINAIAKVMGADIYRVLEIEPAPNDWRIRLINKLYERGLLTEADIEKLADTAKRLAESNKSTGANLDELELGPA